MTKDALEVARRCLCLELLSQRMLLETDTDDPVETREAARKTWLSRHGDLGVEGALVPEERELLERPVGELDDDDLDEVHGLSSGALVLLWALGRLGARPTFATVEALEETLAEHGLLGDGSIARARGAAESAQLRPASELETALSAYARTRGMARETDDPDKIFAGVAAFHLEWIFGTDR